MKKQFYYWSLLLFAAIVVASCKKEQHVVYDVKPEKIYQSASEKKYLKSEVEFVSIAYSDLFENTIPANKLEQIQAPYISFGDKAFVVDLIIRNFMSLPGAKIPADSEMRADVPTFVTNAYLRFYNRYPNEFEQWKLEQIINSDAGISAELVYYTMMTADEYRYY